MFKKKNKIVFIAVGDIMPNPYQPRSYFDDEALVSLAESIKRFGMIQPITVKKREDVTKMNINGQFVSAPAYEIIAGERRFRAAKKIGLGEVPCVIMDCNAEKSAYMAFCENVFREDLSCFDVASALQDMLLITKCTQTELAKKIGISQSAIANKLRLLKLDPDEREFIIKNKLTERHARAFVRIDDKQKRTAFIKKALDCGWSTQETEEKVDNFLINPEAKPKKPKKPKFRGKKIGRISDIGVFINSIDNAVRLVRDVGVNVERKDIDSGDVIEIILKVPKTIH